MNRIPRVAALILFLLCGSFFVFVGAAGCTPRAGSQLQLAEAGAEQFGPKRQYVVFSVPSAGVEDDEEFFRMSRLYGGSELSQRLARLFSESQQREMRVVVGGPSSAKSRYVVLDALRLNRGRTLGGLMVVFVGEASDAEAVGKAAAPFLATVYYQRSG